MTTRTPRSLLRKRRPRLTREEMFGFVIELMFVCAVALAGVPFLVER